MHVGAFSLARTVDPDDDDIDLHNRYVFAVDNCHIWISCNMTHKFRLSENMEDWVEPQHQDGKRSRDNFRRVVNIQMKADGRAHRDHRGKNADVRAHLVQVNLNASRKLNKVKDESAEMKRRKELVANRKAALEQFEEPLLKIFRFVRKKAESLRRVMDLQLVISRHSVESTYCRDI